MSEKQPILSGLYYITLFDDLVSNTWNAEELL